MGGGTQIEGDTPSSQEACLKMPRSLATPVGGRLVLQGDNFVVFNAVVYSVLVSV